MQLEDGIIERRGSLVHLQDDLKKQREQIATIVNQRSAMAATPMPMQSITMPGATSGSFAGSALPNNSFALGLSNAASNVPAIWPTTGVVTSPYGLRWGGTDFHPGIDIANDMGTHADCRDGGRRCNSCGLERGRLRKYGRHRSRQRHHDSVRAC